MSAKWTSWNGNKSHPYTHFDTPSTIDEIASLVKKAKSVRVVGTGRSSSDIAAGTDTLISLEKMNRIVTIDKNSRTVTVETGITLKALLEAIEKEGLSIPCLPDIDVISLGGALATGTHGTGINGHPLSGYITSMTIVNAAGEIEILKESDNKFDAMRVSLGLLGIIVSVTFHCQPLYRLQLTEYPMKDNLWIPSFSEMLQRHPFLRVLWLPHTDYGYVITGDKLADDEKGVNSKVPFFLKYRRKVSALLYRKTTTFPKLTAYANRIIKWLFFSGRQQKSGTLYQASVTKSRGSTLELAEWTIPLSRFEETFIELREELHNMKNRSFAHIPMDVRFIQNDKSWLSYAYGCDTVTVGCVSRDAKSADSYEAFETIERVFLKHGGRPHWAKRFQSKAEQLKKLYPKWDDFIALRQKEDPHGKFLNPYLKELFAS